ncbi:MerR family transcriptional regulator [[Clostridium] innocuum]|nr:MerR family transcriptional regulator [[Clostridium] innocuum]
MNKEFFCHQNVSAKLYRIGVFSQMNRITVKTLRHYDEIDLLKPAYVDEDSGYRYYTSDQLLPLHKILALRDMGFSLEEIRQVFHGASEEQLLQRRKQELLKIIAETSEKLARVEGYLTGGHLEDDYRVILKSLPAVTVASMRVHLDSYADLFYKMPDMGLEMEKAGCVCREPEYCFTMYYDDEYREQDVDAEICEAVTERKEDRGDLKFRDLPSVALAACVMHKGPYRTLPRAYQAIVSFIEDSGYEIIGHQRESYIDGIWNKDSEDEWLTEIQFPVRKIKSIE